LSDWVLIPDSLETGERVAISRAHIVRVSLSPVANAVGRNATGELRLRLMLQDQTIQVVRGKENIKQVLEVLNIPGLRPKGAKDEEGAA
jgi:hypothetical protein